MILPGSYTNGFAPRDGQPLYPELWRGCVGAWNPGLGPSGTTLRDWSGYGNHGSMVSTMSAATGWVSSDGKWANKYDGSDDYVDSIGSVRSFAFVQNTCRFTIAWWQKLSSLTVRMSPLGNATASANSGFTIVNEYGAGVGTNALRILLFKGASGFPVIAKRTADNVLTLNWQHISITGTGSDFQIYINGISQSLTAETAFSSLGSGDSTRTLNIGRTNNSSTIVPMSGWIDDVRIYSAPLEQNSVRLLASRRGIAYELAPRRRSSVQVAAFNRRRRLLVGAGS